MKNRSGVQALTRIALDGRIRLYFDADEQVVGMKLRCSLCKEWPDDGPHAEWCDPEIRIKHSLASIHANLERIK